MDLFQRFFTIARWLPSYDGSTFRADLRAGLSVGVMLIPQGMAYAVLGGLPPIYGLYASLVPLLVYPLFGTARHLASGIVALDMLIVAAGVGALAQAGSDRYVELAILLAAMVGVLQLAMCAARIGFVADLLSRPVIAGFTTAAALVIASSQIGPLLGIDLARSEYVHVTLQRVAAHIGETHPLTVAIGAGSIAFLLLQRWRLPRLPGALLVAGVATAATWALGLGERGVAVTGSVPGGLPLPAIPDVAIDDLRALFSTAITLALIQFMSAISLGRALSARHRYTIRPNHELLGLGAANLVGSVFRSIPVSASFSRSAVNEQSGAETPLSNVVAAVLVGLTLLFLTPLFAFLPNAALAAIIIVSALGLVDVSEMRTLFSIKRRDGLVALLTAISTLVVGIQEGILIGVAASAVAILYRISRPHVAELGLIPGTVVYRDRGRFDEAESIDGILVLRVDASFSFFNAAYFRDYILNKSRSDREGIRAVIVDGRGINDLDTTAIEAICELAGTLSEWGIDFYLSGLKGPVRDTLERSDVPQALDSSYFQLTPHYAVQDVLQQWDEQNDTDRVDAYKERTRPHEGPSKEEQTDDVRLT